MVYVPLVLHEKALDNKQSDKGNDKEVCEETMRWIISKGMSTANSQFLHTSLKI